MGINNRLYKEVRSCSFIFFVLYVFISTHTQLQAFLRILIEKSDLDRIVPSKHQRGDELHKIFTVVCPSSPSPRFLNIACLIQYSLTAEAYPVLNRFEHNWVAAGMVQGNLKNFHSRMRRLVQAAGTDSDPDDDTLDHPHHPTLILTKALETSENSIQGIRK